MRRATCDVQGADVLRATCLPSVALANEGYVRFYEKNASLNPPNRDHD